MLFITASVYFKSEQGLEEVASIISNKLFAGLTFGGKENYIRDEIPTVYIEDDFMGLQILIMGDTTKGVYCLEITPSYDLETEKSFDVDLTEFLQVLVKDVEDIKVLSNKEIEQYEEEFA